MIAAGRPCRFPREITLEDEKLEIKIPYGGASLTCELPISGERICLLKAPDPEPVEELGVIVRKALENPIASPRLAEIVDPSSKVAIIFEDWTRNTPVSGIMSFLLEELKSGGVDDNRITLVCGNGMHDPVHMTKERLIQKLGAGVIRRYRVVSHDAYKPEELEFYRCLRLPGHTFIHQQASGGSGCQNRRG